MAEKQHQWEKVKTANVIGIVSVIFGGAFMVLLMFIEIPSNNKEIVLFLSGSYIGALISAVIFYYFNFKKKDE